MTPIHRLTVAVLLTAAALALAWVLREDVLIECSRVGDGPHWCKQTVTTGWGTTVKEYAVGSLVSVSLDRGERRGSDNNFYATDHIHILHRDGSFWKSRYHLHARVFVERLSSFLQDEQQRNISVRSSSIGVTIAPSIIFIFLVICFYYSPPMMMRSVIGAALGLGYLYFFFFGG